MKLLSNLHSPSELKGMLGELDLFITTRMHVSILSTMRGTPTVTVNTQPKLKGYMGMIAQEKWSCEIADFTVDKAKQLVVDILANTEQVRESLVKARSEIGENALMATTLLRNIYDKKQKDRLLDN